MPHVLLFVFLASLTLLSECDGFRTQSESVVEAGRTFRANQQLQQLEASSHERHHHAATLASRAHGGSTTPGFPVQALTVIISAVLVGLAVLGTVLHFSHRVQAEELPESESQDPALFDLSRSPGRRRGSVSDVTVKDGGLVSASERSRVESEAAASDVPGGALTPSAVGSDDEAEEKCRGTVSDVVARHGSLLAGRAEDGPPDAAVTAAAENDTVLVPRPQAPEDGGGRASSKAQEGRAPETTATGELKPVTAG